MTLLQVLSFDATRVSDLSPLVALGNLESLSLNGTDVGDLSPIEGLSSLDRLWLDGTQVGDLSALHALTSLRILDASDTQISDLSPVVGLTRLSNLGLNDTLISDVSPLSALSGLATLSLEGTLVRDLGPVAALAGLKHLWLGRSRVRDLSPLAHLVGLERLSIIGTDVSDLKPLTLLTELRLLLADRTGISDLSPLASLTNLQDLTLSDSDVRDMRPLLKLTNLGTYGRPGHAFTDTPATRADPILNELSRLDDEAERAEKTLAHLATLPPWPEPLDPPETDTSILTVEAVLKSQSPLGWRFSPADGAMEVYTEAGPTTALQEQLARMSGERAQTLKAALAGANHGLRGEARVEVDRFTALLDDGLRPLSARSVELWGSLVALGGLLDGNDTGRVQGRDPLDLLSVEQRAALQTLLQIAGNLVRSFPDVKALDDSAGGFLRREISIEMVAAMIEAALRATYVTPGSAALMQHVAAVGLSDGPQADKATSVSVRGIGNLIQTAALIVGKGSFKLAGAAALGAAGYVGAQGADHYDLDEAAFAYFEEITDLVEPFLFNLPPDEAAVLQSTLHDTRAKLDAWARQKTASEDVRRGLEQGQDREDGPRQDLKKF
ncbi:MAG: leucine-rich repeat domain-containing protein [Tabrizicola sp.]|uniref:leucine-rich repeat domain-containing protein n=1 Tax=Tabrizicola sp. TaxID=2005166 RepID=UPI002ABCBE0E|nr:leucine-rich repeat domain-containing protein [Tabrizicola sp.]MDZ4085716.1 leucine-rich repeat domain-containing protein [Tabrizicola sp.]